MYKEGFRGFSPDIPAEETASETQKAFDTISYSEASERWYGAPPPEMRKGLSPEEEEELENKRGWLSDTELAQCLQAYLEDGNIEDIEDEYTEASEIFSLLGERLQEKAGDAVAAAIGGSRGSVAIDKSDIGNLLREGKMQIWFKASSSKPEDFGGKRYTFSADVVVDFANQSVEILGGASGETTDEGDHYLPSDAESLKDEHPEFEAALKEAIFAESAE